MRMKLRSLGVVSPTGNANINVLSDSGSTYYGDGGSCPVVDLSKNLCMQNGYQVACSLIRECDSLTGQSHYEIAFPPVQTPRTIAPPPPQPPVTYDVPKLTPQNLAKPLPDITAVLTPVRVPDCSCWEKLNSWIGDNPLVAVAALGGAFLFMRGAMRRG